MSLRAEGAARKLYRMRVKEELMTSENETKTLGSLIKGIRFAMLTTVGEDGALYSRPMATQKTKFDGTLWFFTNDQSPKALQLLHDRHVNVAYAEPIENTYV